MSVTVAVVAVVVWIAAAYRFKVLWSNPSYAKLNYLLIMVFAAGALTVKTVQGPIDVFVGPYTSDLVEHLLAVAMGAATQVYLLSLRVKHPAPATVTISVLTAVTAGLTMIGAFAAAPIHYLALPPASDLDDLSGTLWSVQLYRLAFVLYLTFVLVNVVNLYRAYGRQPGDQGRSINLRLIGWGAGIGLVYTATRLVSLASGVVTERPLLALEHFGSIAAVIGLLVVAVGVVSPRIQDWYAARRDARRLAALWRDLTQACPAVILPAPVSWIPTVQRAEFICERRLVETIDALRLVRLPARRPGDGDNDPYEVADLAEELHATRGEWTMATGPTPAECMPVSISREMQTSRLLALADSYAAVSSGRSRPAVEVR